MAGPKPSVNLAQELFGNAYPSARDHVIRKNQVEKQANARKHAAGGNTSKVQEADGAKRGGYIWQQEPGMPIGYKTFVYSNNIGAPRRQQRPGMAENKGLKKGVGAPPAPVQAPPPPPPSLFDANEFPSLK